MREEWKDVARKKSWGSVCLFWFARFAKAAICRVVWSVRGDLGIVWGLPVSDSSGRQQSTIFFNSIHLMEMHAGDLENK